MLGARAQVRCQLLLCFAFYCHHSQISLETARHPIFWLASSSCVWCRRFPSVLKCVELIPFWTLWRICTCPAWCPLVKSWWASGFRIRTQSFWSGWLGTGTFGSTVCFRRLKFSVVSFRQWSPAVSIWPRRAWAGPCRAQKGRGTSSSSKTGPSSCRAIASRWPDSFRSGLLLCRWSRPLSRLLAGLACL